MQCNKRQVQARVAATIRRLLRGVLMFSILGWSAPAVTEAALADLARPIDGRSMRATSAHRSGPDGAYDPGAPFDPDSNWDNQNLAPGDARVLLDAEGPGVVTHIWMTFLGPEPQDWAPEGSANHQEMLLRIY